MLLQNGAEIDALGGDLVATPLQWAARNGFIYVIQLLIEWGADPTIRDSQGYNSLHLVTHSSGVMPLLYLLNLPDQDDEISSGSASRKKGVSVDSVDSSGHTALMWACYQGDAISVSLLLRHNANANARDDAGLTPLHWAVVRANRTIIRKLVEAGADLSAKDGEGRTPKEMAAELKSSGAFKRALEEGGLDDTGRPMKKPLSDVRISFLVGNSAACCLLSFDNKAQHQARNPHFTYSILLPDIHDLDCSSLVYRRVCRVSRILCITSCELILWQQFPTLLSDDVFY